MSSQCSENPREITFDDIAKKLLEEKYFLTSLELHAELVEAGIELPTLKEFFSNPLNYETLYKPVDGSSTSLNRSLSQTTLDSLDWARYSEDGERTTDDKIAILEFELRKAKETISALRKTLTELTEPEQSDVTDGTSRKSSCHSEELKPHQVSTLNFLVNEYLVNRGYKMTAITFADETDNQDFENWDDVGLNIQRPPSLVEWWQGKGPKYNPTSNADCQTEEFTPDFDVSQLESLSKEVEHLKMICLKQDEEIMSLRRKSSTPHVTPFGSPSKANQSEPYPMGCTTEIIDDFSQPDDDGFSNPVIDSIEEAANTDFKTIESLPDLPRHAINSIGETVNTDFKSVESLQDPEFPNHLGSIEDAVSTQPLESAPENVDQPSVCSDEVRSKSPSESQNDIDDTDLDPQKCDRLSPLGASEDWGRQGSLGGEFISAQRQEAKDLLSASFSRQLPSHLENVVLNICIGQTLEVDSRLQREVASLSLSDCNLVDLVSASLPNIAPNVLLAKREEILPLLVYSIIQQKNENRREKLLHLLFNLTKKPDKTQRQTILLGLVCLARVLGHSRLEAELLPQCWEQLTHKYSERRLLVAQSVGVLSPYTPPHIRNSLLLSMLQQILAGDEKEPQIIEAATASLALLVAYLDDTDKITPLIDTMLKCIENMPITDTSKTNQRVLYSCLAQLCLDMGQLQQFLLSQVLKLRTLVSTYVQEMELNRKAKSDQLRKEIQSILMYLSTSVPYILAMLMKSMPHEVVSCQVLLNPKVSALIEELSVIYSVPNVEDKYNTLEKTVASWPELDFVVHKLVPSLVEQTSMLESCKQIVSMYSNLFIRICLCLGSMNTETYIKPLFTQYFSSDKSTSHLYLVKSTLVVYISAILESTSITPFLTEQICLCAKHDLPISGIELAITLLLEKGTHEESILGALWACVVDRSPIVRIHSAPLWSLLVGHVKETDLASRVVPALVTIATDSNNGVKAASLVPLTTVLSRATNQEVCDKVKIQLESVCDQAVVVESPELQIGIAQTCTKLGHSIPPIILQNLFLPCICRSVLEGIGTTEQKRKLGVCVLEAFSALVSVVIPNHVVAHFILPPLNMLQKTLGASSLENMETITSLTKEFTMRAQTTDKPRGLHQSNSIATGMAAMSSGLSRHGVEDVKNTMSKIGRAMSGGVQVKTPAINIPNLFKRK